MISAQEKAVANGKTSRVQVMIQCRQKQWNSGLCKDKYCQDCPNKEECFELLGR